MPELASWARADGGGGGAPAFAAALAPAADGCAGRLCNYYKAVREVPVLQNATIQNATHGIVAMLGGLQLRNFSGSGFSVSQFFFLSLV